MILDAGQRRSLERFARGQVNRISRFRLQELVELGLVADHGDSHLLTPAGAYEHGWLVKAGPRPRCLYQGCWFPRADQSRLGLCDIHDKKALKVLGTWDKKRAMTRERKARRNER